MGEDKFSMHKKKKFWLIIAILFGLILLPFIIAFIRYRSLISLFLAPATTSENILILGKGGVGHEAPDLTDTIIFVSLTERKISLVSLPRDIWVPEIRAKLNSAYYWGGMALTKSAIEKITGQTINHILVIDFSGFKSIIDSLGGIEVDVDESFVDEKYPIPGHENDSCIPCRYETLRFTQGKQIMDGETALKFVRSRNAEGDEGTDAARSVRQQVVVEAIKNKVLSPDILTNPNKLLGIKNAVLGSLQTDIGNDDLAVIFSLASKSAKNLVTYTIPEEMLINPPISPRYDNQYVFVPSDGTWAEFHLWFQDSIGN